MKAKFIGVPGEPEHQQLEMYGQVFPLDKWVDVIDKHGQRKLANHPHFESKDAATDVEVKPLKVPTLGDK